VDAADVRSALLVLIDVDGVLNPTFSAAQRRRLAYHHGWLQRRACVDGLALRVFVNPAHGAMLRRLARETGAELAWGTTWEEAANYAIGPLIGLPVLPVAPVRGFAHKAEGIVPWTRGRPFAWLDDEPDAAQACARIAGAQPHLVVGVDEHEGLAEAHVEAVRAWLGGLPA
jgi:hypothetical protein